MSSFEREPERNDDTQSASDEDVGVDLRTSLLDAYLSQVGASAAVLGRLASTPVGSKRQAAAPGRARVDVVLAAPTQAWADAVIARLRDAIGAGVEVLQMSPTVPDGEATYGWNMR